MDRQCLCLYLINWQIDFYLLKEKESRSFYKLRGTSINTPVWSQCPSKVSVSLWKENLFRYDNAFLLMQVMDSQHTESNCSIVYTGTEET